MPVSPYQVHPAVLAQHNTLLRAVNSLLVHHINTVKSQPQTFNQAYNSQYTNRATAHPQKQTNAYGQPYHQNQQSQFNPSYYMAPLQRVGNNINQAFQGFVKQHNLDAAFNHTNNPWDDQPSAASVLGSINPTSGKFGSALEGQAQNIAENYPGGVMGFLAGGIE